MIGVVAKHGEHPVIREFFELFKTPWEFCRKGVRYDVVVRADDTVEPSPLAGMVIVYGGQATAVDRGAEHPPGPRRQGAIVSWKGDRIPVYGACVTLPSADRTLDLVLEDTGEPVASVTRRDGSTLVRVGYDLFREVGFLLSRGQPVGHAAIPTLERHIGFLRHAIVSGGIPLVEIPPIPEGYRFIACLTHDVDHPAIGLHWFDHTMFGFLYRAVVSSVVDVCRGKAPLSALWRNWAAVLRLPFVHLGLANDFWNQFDRYLTIEKGLGSTFFVIPVKDYPGRTGGGFAPRIRASAYGVSDIADCLRPLRATGSEVALHGIDAWLDSSTGSEERARVSRATGASVTGVRMHWLFFDERAPERLDEAGFTYDATFGYNETVGFRAGTLQAFKPVTAGRLLELPLTIMDTALFYPSHLDLTPKAAHEMVRRLLDEAERYGGVVTINWHDRSLAPERLWGEFYAELVDEVKRRGAWCPTAAQAVSWFSRRRSAAIESVQWNGDSPQVAVSADDRSDLPGLIVRVHTPEPPDGGRGPERFCDMAFNGGLVRQVVGQP
jgi:hypothetical protein